MSEELQNALAQLLTSFVNSMGGAADFALEQAPEVIQQLLLWKFTISAISFSLGALLIVSSIVALRRRLTWSPPKIAERPDVSAETMWLSEQMQSPTWDIKYHAGSLLKALGEKPRPAPRQQPPDHLFLVAAALGIFGIGSVLGSLAWFQIWLAPKVYLIEYAASLAK